MEDEKCDNLGSCPQMRENWEQMIQYGPRPFGSASVKACSDYLLNEMMKITDSAFVEDYDAEAWEPGGWALQVVGPESRRLESYLFLGSGASNAFEGKVVFAGYNRIWNMYVWKRYAVVDTAGQILAYVTVRGNGAAIPQMLFTGPSELPHFLVGAKEADFFAKAQEEGVILKGYAQAKPIKDAKCYNVIGLLGEAPQKVVICAHYDTVYNTPGAYDNASGAAVLLELGRRLKKGYRLHKQIELLLTDGEEYDLVGSRKRCETCKEDSIEMLLCIDGVGRDQVLEVWSGPEPFERKIRKILGKSQEVFTPVYQCPPPPGSDQEPYYSAGIPACMLTFNDQGILHSPEDVYEESKLKNMYVMINLALDLLENLGVVEKTIEFVYEEDEQ